MAVRIQIRRDTAANWVSSNPVLRAGEVGIETDTLKFKIGNGSSTWTQITNYANVTSTGLSNSLNDYILASTLGNPSGPAKLNSDGEILVPEDTIILWNDAGYTYTTKVVATQPTANRIITLPNNTGTVALTSDLVTTNVSEGTNLYFTDERAQDATAAALAAGTHTNITVTYNDNANTLSLAAAPGYVDEQAVDAVAAALAAGTHTNISVSYNDNANSISLTGAVTYTDENAQDAVGNAVGNGLDYDDTTGAISVDPSEFALSAVGAPTSDVSMATYKITGLGTPTSDNDAANKAYVDAATSGLNVHASVKAATTGNININNELEAGDTLDGVVLANGDRVLVKNQNSPEHNGVYIVQNSGAATRATDYNTVGEVDAGDFIFVENGTANAKTGWIQTNKITTLDTDHIEFSQFSGAGTYSAGTGLTLTGSVFSINTGTTVDLNTAQTLTNKTITGTFSGNITGNVTGDVSGNAGTVTNGVYTTGSYADPAWITSLAKSKVGLGNVENTALSTWAGSTNITTLGTVSTGTWNATAIGPTKGGTGLTSYASGDILYASATDTLAKLAKGTDGQILTLASGVPSWAAAPITLPSQTGNAGYYLTTDGTNASWGALVVPITTGTATVTANTATTVDTVALSGFTSIEYMVSLKQGSKVRTSKVVVQTDGTSVDMTEFAITETGGQMTGVVVSATTSSTNAVLQVTVTDATSTNVDVKFSKVKL